MTARVRIPRAGPAASPEAFFADLPVGLATLGRVHLLVDAIGPYAVRTTRSQVAFRRARGFAWLWDPGRYLEHAQVQVVLSIALGREDPSPRFKQVAHPSPNHWIHHLEVRDASEVDDEVAAWLQEAWARAG